jgi:hypothetical protein
MAISRSDMERQLRKDGGILTLDDARKMAPPGESLAYINPEEAALLKSLGGAGEDINGTGIKSYFFKKVFRKAKKAVKKVVKSPLGKIALLGAATLPFGGPGAALKGLGGMFGKGGGLGKLLSGMKNMGLGKQLGLIGGIGGLGGLLAAQEAEDAEDQIDINDRGETIDYSDVIRRARLNDPEFRFLPPSQFQNLAEGGGVGSLAMNKENVKQKFVSDEAGAIAKKGGGVTPEDMGKLKRSDFDNEENYKRYLRQLNRKAEGGTIKDFEKFMKERMEMEKTMNQKRLMEDFKQYMNRGKPVEAKEGGIMDLGGNEMDLRGGGFVPLGAKEKADDVPARLSKNEFVMTADAVRAAGGGSVDKGADKMYNMMKNLEAQV